ncbi:MAG: glycoside hydrolase family 125 protein, partial [Anaerorhabdus sp.]
HAKKDIHLSYEFIENLTEATRTLFRTYPLNVEIARFYNKWTNTNVVEYRHGGALCAISYNHDYEEEIQLCPNESHIITCIVTIGIDADGATLHNMDMQRRGSKKLKEEFIKVLDERHLDISNESLSKLVNLNLNMCYYFSLSETLDTKELVAMTSRSPRYYVSSAFWARDVYLWAFPSIVLANRKKARELLNLGYTRYRKNSAYHALYINGNILYPGFELDELVSVIIATEKYIEMTHDDTILEIPEYKDTVKEILSQLEDWYEPSLGLYRTELNPSDDPLTNQFLCHDNTLVYRMFEFIHDDRAEILKQNILKHFVKDNIFVYALGDQGEVEIYDNPPGSLITLPYYGLIDKNDERYKNTLNKYFSTNNNYYYEDVYFGQGSEHAPYIWPMSLCNHLLANGYNEKIMACFETMKLDNGFACETIDAKTSKAKTGAAFATFAGYLAYSIYKVSHHD